MSFIAPHHYSVKCKIEKAHDNGVWCCAWSANDQILTGSLDNNLKLWSWSNDSLEFVRNLEGHRLGIISVDFNQSGSMAVSSSIDNQILFWDVDSGRLIKTYEGDPGETWSVAFSPDSRFVSTGSHSGSVNMINCESGVKESSIALMEGGAFIYCLAYSPDGTRLAAGSMSGAISLVDLQTGRISPLDGHSLPVRSLTFSRDSRLLASCSDDAQIKVYSVPDCRTIVSSLDGHRGWVSSIDFSPDLRHLSSASTDSTVRIWDISSKQEVHSFTEHQEQVWSAHYNPTGDKLLSTSDDRSLCVYACPA